MLSEADFVHVVRSAPLVSIDLLIKNKTGQYLLGLRTNAPARGSWFVPGGRILKNESLQQAKRRLSKIEIGKEISPESFSFVGVYEHFYPDNTFRLDGFGTHYVVLAFSIDVQGLSLDRPFEQHAKFKWFSREDILNSDLVHAYSKAYFAPK